MRVTQGAFSFLPDLTDEQIHEQVQYCIDNGWAVIARVHRRPAPPEHLLGDVGPPDVRQSRTPPPSSTSSTSAASCTATATSACSPSTRRPGWESVRLSFIVNRPEGGAGLRLERQESDGRRIRYTIQSYATDRPEGARYAP